MKRSPNLQDSSIIHLNAILYLIIAKLYWKQLLQEYSLSMLKFRMILSVVKYISILYFNIFRWEIYCYLFVEGLHQKLLFFHMAMIPIISISMKEADANDPHILIEIPYVLLTMSFNFFFVLRFQSNSHQHINKFV